MAFNASKMEVFSRRCRNLCSSLQGIREESERLLAIYHNETAYGEDAAFADTSLATKQEHIDVILLCGDLASFFGNAAVATVDREQWLTPFLQSE